MVGLAVAGVAVVGAGDVGGVGVVGATLEAAAVGEGDDKEVDGANDAATVVGAGLIVGAAEVVGGVVGVTVGRAEGGGLIVGLGVGAGDTEGKGVGVKVVVGLLLSFPSGVARSRGVSLDVQDAPAAAAKSR